VAHKQHAGARRHAGPDRPYNLFGGRDRQGHRLADVARAALAAHEAPGAVQRAVLVIGGQDLVARSQRQRTGHDVQAGGGVGDVDQVVRVRADGGPQRRAGLAHQWLEAPAQELDRLAFELQLPALAGFEDGTRARAERAVVEEDHVGAKEEQVAQSGIGV